MNDGWLLTNIATDDVNWLTVLTNDGRLMMNDGCLMMNVDWLLMYVGCY
jgi:hypothetical protein